MAIRKRLLAVAMAGLLLCGAVPALAEEGKRVRADFSAHTGVPYFKRQNTFSVSYSFGMTGNSAPFVKAAEYLSALRSENMRVDLSMGNGGLGQFFAMGDAERMTHQFLSLDALMKVLYKNGTAPYFSYGYMPKSLQPENGTFRSAPKDMDAWRRLCRDIAAHYREKGWPLAAHEVWNEPDLADASGQKIFFSGTWREYIDLYENAVLGIREADPTATVGGLSLAFLGTFERSGKIDGFLDAVKEKRLPLDFISYHNYGTSRYLNDTRVVNRLLSSYGDAFKNVALHLNEFHVVDTAGVTTYEASRADTASLMLHAIANLVEMPAVTSVNWATWRDNGEGLNMVDNKKGARFASHHALQLYNTLPIDRVAFTPDGALNGMAACDGNRAGVLLYTRAVKDSPVTLALDNLPFDRADITVYAVDEGHSSVLDGCESDEIAVVDELRGVSTKDLVWLGRIARRGILYLDIRLTGADEDQAPVWSMEGDTPMNAGTATVARKEYRFEDRNTTMFSEFDLGTFTAWAGMGDADRGTAAGGAVIENLPDRFIVKKTMYGAPEAGYGAYLRAEYRTESGETIARYLFGEGSADGDAVLGDSFVLPVPEGLENGQLYLTWGLIDAGEDTAIKLSLTK